MAAAMMSLPSKTPMTRRRAAQQALADISNAAEPAPSSPAAAAACAPASEEPPSTPAADAPASPAPAALVGATPTGLGLSGMLPLSPLPATMAAPSKTPVATPLAGVPADGRVLDALHAAAQVGAPALRCVVRLHS